jgi:hypothetical protein
MQMPKPSKARRTAQRAAKRKPAPLDRNWSYVPAAIALQSARLASAWVSSWMLLGWMPVAMAIAATSGRRRPQAAEEPNSPVPDDAANIGENIIAFPGRRPETSRD